MSDEYSKPPYKKITGIPEGYTWSDMNTLKGAELEEQYKKTLEKLAKEVVFSDRYSLNRAIRSAMRQFFFALCR